MPLVYTVTQAYGHCTQCDCWIAPGHPHLRDAAGPTLHLACFLAALYAGTDLRLARAPGTPAILTALGTRALRLRRVGESLLLCTCPSTHDEHWMRVGDRYLELGGGHCVSIACICQSLDLPIPGEDDGGSHWSLDTLPPFPPVSDAPAPVHTPTLVYA
jgi:hypothetical protein